MSTAQLHGYTTGPDDFTLDPESAEIHFANAQLTINEVIRQVLKFGANRNLPDVSPPPSYSYHDLMLIAQEVTDQHAEQGNLTWGDILTEEVMEAYAAESDADRITELIQVAAVCWSWIEDIRTRT